MAHGISVLKGLLMVFGCANMIYDEMPQNVLKRNSIKIFFSLDKLSLSSRKPSNCFLKVKRNLKVYILNFKSLYNINHILFVYLKVSNFVDIHSLKNEFADCVFFLLTQPNSSIILKKESH